MKIKISHLKNITIGILTSTILLQIYKENTEIPKTVEEEIKQSIIEPITNSYIGLIEGEFYSEINEQYKIKEQIKLNKEGTFYLLKGYDFNKDNKIDVVANHSQNKYSPTIVPQFSELPQEIMYDLDQDGKNIIKLERIGTQLFLNKELPVTKYNTEKNQQKQI